MKKLIFIYNADTGLFNTVSDFAHKIISPNTYACSLCQITHGNFGMKKEWKTFIEKLPYDMQFLHKDEALIQYTNLKNELFPMILMAQDNGEQSILLNAEELAKKATLTALINGLSEKLNPR